MPQPVGLYPMPGSNIPVAPLSDPVTATLLLNDPRANPGSPVQQLRVIESLPVPDPNPARRSACIFFSMLYQGRPYLSFAYVQVYPVSNSEWIYQYSTMAAPPEIFKRDFALLMQTYTSWQPDPNLFRQRIQDAMNSMRQAGEIYRSALNSGPNYGGINEAWDRYIRGFDTVEHIPSGRQFTVNLRDADKFCRDMGNQWRCVPASQTKE